MLLHGGNGSWMQWVRNIAVVAGRYTVWVFDLPGYGDSDAAASTDLSSVVKPAIAGLDTLFATNGVIDLVSFFFGGMVAAHIAARRGLVRRLGLAWGWPATAERTGHAAKCCKGARSQMRGDAAALSAVMRNNLEMHMLHEPARIDALALRIIAGSWAPSHLHGKAFEFAWWRHYDHRLTRGACKSRRNRTNHVGLRDQRRSEPKAVQRCKHPALAPHPCERFVDGATEAASGRRNRSSTGSPMDLRPARSWTSMATLGWHFDGDGGLCCANK